MVMKALIALLTLVVALGIFLGPALAQELKTGPAAGPAEDQMARMMTMMGEMQEQMKHMQAQMKGMQEMGQTMGQMRSMMERHRSEMQKPCPGAAAPHAPNHGG
jgi:hypothetical protein